MEYKQMSFLPSLDKTESNQRTDDIEVKEAGDKNITMSERLKADFDIMALPFLGCNYDSVYHKLANIIPEEPIMFDDFPLEVEIMAEIVSAGICHQMNWDYLRRALYEKLNEDNEWVMPDRLVKVETKEVAALFSSYDKPERIRSKERTFLLHIIGDWARQYKNVTQIFQDENGDVLPKEIIRHNLLSCVVFSSDIEEKKMKLLIQKISLYKGFKQLCRYCEPAIDYHLIRTYLRRGLLYAKTEHAKKYIMNQNAERKESTVAALRHLCGELMVDISSYSDLDINIINQIDWHIGRSVCLQNKPDCYLRRKEAKWLRPSFSKCPFFDTCAARCGNRELLDMKEPVYRGLSY